jgi:hypothetical protein
MVAYPDRIWSTLSLLRGALSPWVNRPGSENDHPLPTSAEVKNA